jgi:hypothetical protein
MSCTCNEAAGSGLKRWVLQMEWACFINNRRELGRDSGQEGNGFLHTPLLDLLIRSCRREEQSLTPCHGTQDLIWVNMTCISLSGDSEVWRLCRAIISELSALCLPSQFSTGVAAPSALIIYFEDKFLAHFPFSRGTWDSRCFRATSSLKAFHLLKQGLVPCVSPRKTLLHPYSFRFLYSYVLQQINISLVCWLLKVSSLQMTPVILLEVKSNSVCVLFHVQDLEIFCLPFSLFLQLWKCYVLCPAGVGASVGNPRVRVT